MKSIVYIIKINNNVIKLSPQYAKLVLKYEDLGRCKTLQLCNYSFEIKTVKEDLFQHKKGNTNAQVQLNAKLAVRR